MTETRSGSRSQLGLFDIGSLNLREVRITEFGVGVTLVAVGDRGERTLRCEPVGRYLHCPGSDPCPECKDRHRCTDIAGCPCAEAWHRVKVDYMEATR